MRKRFNVCLPVERGRQHETVIAERERGEEKKYIKNLSEAARQTLLLMRYDLSGAHVSLAGTCTGTHTCALAESQGGVRGRDRPSVRRRDLSDRVAALGGRDLGVFRLR